MDLLERIKPLRPDETVGSADGQALVARDGTA